MGLVVQIGADLSKFEREMNNATKDISYLGDKLGKVGGSLTKSVTLPIVGVGVAAGKMSMDFETSFAKVNTLLADGTDLEAYKKSLIDASSETGIALGEYTDAVQEAISSDIDQADAIAFTTQAMKLAKGGFTTGATAVDILTTAINGYGLEADQATKLSDMLIQTQNYGKTTVDELAASMGKVIPIAANANYGMEELSTAYAVLTKNGIATAESGTYMKSMLAELTKSGSVADKALKELAGKGFAELKSEGASTTDILQMLKDGAEASGKGLKDMFGSSEAGTAALTLLKDGGEDYNNILKDMTNSSGAAQAAADKMADTAQAKLSKAFNELKNTMVEVGATLIPVVAKVAEGISKLVGWFNDLSPAGKVVMGTIVGLAAVIGPLILAVAKAIEIYKKYKEISGLIKAANISTTVSMFGITVPIWAVVAAVVGIIAVGYLLIKHWDTVKEFLSATWEGIKVLAEIVWNGLSAFFSTMWEAMKVGAEAVWNGLVTFFTTIFEVIKTLFVTVFTIIKDGVIQRFTNIKNTIMGILSNVVSIISTSLTNAKNLFSAIFNTIVTVVKSSFQIVHNTISSIINGIKNIIQNVLGMIKGIFTGDLGLIKSSVSNIFGSIRDTISNIMSGAGNIVKGAIDKIKGFFNFKWELPKLKMPHFSMTGKFSLNPPSIPKIGVDWYHKGGIFTKPTVLGNIGVGDALNGKGNGAEAVLPLKKLPELLGLDKQNNAPQTITTVVQLDGREIARATSNYMDTELRKNRDGKSRANGGR